MMKLALIAFTLLASTDAFSISHNHVAFRKCSMLKMSASNEASKSAIQEALETSKKFGPTSKEARVAWDIVEELNASDNRYDF